MGEDAVKPAVVTRRHQIEILVGRIKPHRAHEGCKIGLGTTASVAVHIQQHQLQIGLSLVAGDADDDLADTDVLLMNAAAFFHADIVAVHRDPVMLDQDIFLRHVGQRRDEGLHAGLQGTARCRERLGDLN